MPKFLSDRPTLRGFLIIVLIALVVVALNQYTALLAIAMLLRIAFFLAVAFFVYLMWRERRGEIESWSTRERVVFYGSALLIVAAIGLYFWHGLPATRCFASGAAGTPIRNAERLRGPLTRPIRVR